MYYVEEMKLNRAASLLTQCGLQLPVGTDYTAGVYRDDGKLVGTGSLKGDMIQGIAVDPAFQGEDLTAKLITHLLGKASGDYRSLYLFTKPEKASQFTGLGFRLVASARPYAALLEWGEAGVKQYMERLAAVRRTVEGSPIGALVMNCNPFTLGHRYLIEAATKACAHVYVLVVEEEASLFPFADRLEMVRRGTEDLAGVTVLSGGRYAVSSLTFPSYFTKEENLAKAHAAMDCQLFADCIAPALGVNMRFVGSEPLSPVTAVYNETLQERLPKRGIEVVELPRLEKGGQVISASRVRAILQADGAAKGKLSHETTALLSALVPQSTLDYIMQMGEQPWKRERQP